MSSSDFESESVSDSCSDKVKSPPSRPSQEARKGKGKRKQAEDAAVAAEGESSGAGSRSKRHTSVKPGVYRMKESAPLKGRGKGKRRNGKK